MPVEWLDRYSDEEILAELRRRHLTPRCPCKKWPLYLSGRAWRCHGCTREAEHCTCA